MQCRRPQFNSWVGKVPWRRDRLPTPVFLGFPYGSAGKESACNAGDLASILGLGRSPRERKGYPLQYSDLENSIDCIYSPWDCKQSDRSEWFSLSPSQKSILLPDSIEKKRLKKLCSNCTVNAISNLLCQQNLKGDCCKKFIKIKCTIYFSRYIMNFVRHFLSMDRKNKINLLKSELQNT